MRRSGVTRATRCASRSVRPNPRSPHARITHGSIRRMRRRRNFLAGVPAGNGANASDSRAPRASWPSAHWRSAVSAQTAATQRASAEVDGIRSTGAARMPAKSRSSGQPTAAHLVSWPRTGPRAVDARAWLWPARCCQRRFRADMNAQWIRPDWPAAPMCMHLITTRAGGVSRGPYGVPPHDRGGMNIGLGKRR